jgi:hypothetical protein
VQLIHRTEQDIEGLRAQHEVAVSEMLVAG